MAIKEDSVVQKISEDSKLHLLTELHINTMNWMQSSWLSDDCWNSYINPSTDWLKTTCNVVRKSDAYTLCACVDSNSRGNHSKFKSQAYGQFVVLRLRQISLIIGTDCFDEMVPCTRFHDFFLHSIHSTCGELIEACIRGLQPLVDQCTRKYHSLSFIAGIAQKFKWNEHWIHSAFYSRINSD